MRILDATAGNRGIWFDKNYPDATFIDVRAKGETSELHQENQVADCRHTPFRAGTFDLVVFDPPHMAIGPNAEMAKRYGSFSSAYIRELCAAAFVEFYRVLRPDGLVAFKWNDHDTPLSRVLPISGFDALVGVRVARRMHHKSETSWVLLRRRATNDQARLEAF